MPAAARLPCDMVLPAAAAAAHAPDAARWALVVAVLASGMAFIDASAVNVALPVLQRELAATTAEVQWVVNGYTLPLSALILLGGSLGDRFGRRRVFLWGVGVFGLASALCAMAPGPTMLIAARVLQGIGGALVVPSSLALICAAFAPADRARAIGTWAGAAALTTAAGPGLGGWLVDALSWRWVFLVNLPFAAAALVIALWRLPPDELAPQTRPTDWAGAALATLGLGLVCWAMIAAGEGDSGRATVLLPGLLGLALLAAFLRVETCAAAPLVPLGLFRSRVFAGANLLTLLLYAALSGALFLLPFELIRLHGYSAAGVGAALLPFTLIMGGLSRWAGGLVGRFGLRAPLVVGPVLAGAAFTLWALPRPGLGYWGDVFPAMLLLGLGMTIAVAPLTAAVMGAVDEASAGAAPGINNAAARLAGLFAVAAAGAAAQGLAPGLAAAPDAGGQPRGHAGGAAGGSGRAWRGGGAAGPRRRPGHGGAGWRVPRCGAGLHGGRGGAGLCGGSGRGGDAAWPGWGDKSEARPRHLKALPSASKLFG